MEEVSPQTTPPPPPFLADGEFHHVDRNSIPVGRIGMAINAAVLLGMAFVVLSFIAFNPRLAAEIKVTALTIWIAMFPLLGILGWVWPGVRYRHTFYSLRADRLIIRRGVFWKIETVVPKSRIQHIDISQGPVQRSYQVSDLVIHTAGTRFALVPLPGLSQSLAPRLRNLLLDRRDDDNTL